MLTTDKGRSAVKPTLERVLDAAEELFATHGFAATSLGDVTDQVGIRGPAIYKHFKNKQHLYEQVLKRLLDPPLARLLELKAQLAAGTSVNQDYVEQLMQYHVAHPNAARMVQQASLAGGEQLDFVVERWLRPIINTAIDCWSSATGVARRDDAEAIAVYMACTQLFLSYVTLNPLFDKVFEENTANSDYLKTQVQLIKQVALFN